MKNLKKNAKGYGYNYTDLAEINKYLESVNCDYIQRIAVENGTDYIETKRCIEGEWETEWIRGSRVIQATLSGKNNPAQEQGSGLTYARRYSLLMAFGLATTDDDGQMMTTYTISDALANALKERCISEKIPKERIQDILSNYGYEKFKDIEKENYESLVKELFNEK